ncbi:MAG: RNA polymerase sigma factor [Bacteroidales bacterium]|nr:RNA polymerase sigma factor [Bacteroidales bacterium]
MTDKEYKEIVMQFSDRVLRFLKKNLRSGEDAEDILQESLITLWNNRANVETIKAKSYLFTVAYHNMLNILKQTKTRGEMVKDINDFDSFDSLKTLNNYDTKQLISYAMEQLPENMKTCLLLKDWEGYKTDEIAQIMKITEDNVKITLFRARQKMREILGNI